MATKINVKGAAIENAVAYDLYEKNSDGTYTKLAEDLTADDGIEINLTALGLAEGSHTLVVRARGDGVSYSDSPYSNEVVYSVAAAQYTLTIVPTPSTATVTLNGVAQNSITVDSGTEVTWSVEADGYTTQSGTWTASADEEKAVELSLEGETDISDLFSATFETGAIIADTTHSSYGGAATNQTAYVGNTANSSYINISAYAGSTLRITLPLAIGSAHITYGLVFYTGQGKSYAIGGVTMSYTDGSVAAETIEVEIPSDAKYARTTWHTEENETACGVAFSAKIIA